MEHKKAKKAKKMAEEAMRMMALEEQIAQMSQADLQPEDGYINPMGRIGTVPPSTYSLRKYVKWNYNSIGNKSRNLNK